MAVKAIQLTHDTELRAATVKVDGPNISALTFGWAVQREFVDSMLAAARKFDPSLTEDRFVFLSQEDGCAVVTMQAPVSFHPAFRHVTASRGKQWCHRFYSLLDHLGASASLAMDPFEPVTAEPAPTGHRVDGEIRCMMPLSGKIVAVIASSGSVRLELEDGRIVTCTASEHLTDERGDRLEAEDFLRAAGKLVLQPVLVHGMAFLDRQTRRPHRFEVEQLLAAPVEVRSSRPMRELADELRAMTRDITREEFLAEVRG